MYIRQLIDRATSTYTYLVASDQGEAALIDPVVEQVDRDLALLEELGLTLRYVIDTHTHADHITAAGTLRDRTGARSVVSERGAACADLHVGHQERLPLGELEIEVLATPGHTDDSISLKVGDNVFTGDSLLIRRVGRTDFQRGDSDVMYASVQDVLFALPDQTKVWPGHDYQGLTWSTIGEEKVHNPRIAGRTMEEFSAVMAGLGLAPPARIEESVPANLQCGQPAQGV